MAVKQAHTEQIVQQLQLMIDTVHAQELTKPTVVQRQNMTSMVQDKVQLKRHQLATPHTINMELEQAATKQILMVQPHLMISTEEKQAHSKPIQQVEPPNTTATAEKLEVLNRQLAFY